MYERGVPVSHISDVVRFTAAAEEGGVVLDCDLWWIREAPRSPFVATLYEKAEGGRSNPSAAVVARHDAFARPGWNGHGLVNTPVGVCPRPSRFAIALGNQMTAFTEDYTREDAIVRFDPNKDWNVLMHGVRDIVLRLDMGCEARPPIEFGASLSWGSHRKKPSRCHVVEPIP